MAKSVSLINRLQVQVFLRFQRSSLLQLVGFADAAHATDLKTHDLLLGLLSVSPVVPASVSWKEALS
jgi:hypothetical protein